MIQPIPQIRETTKMVSLKLNELTNDSLGYVVCSLLTNNGLDKSKNVITDVINYLYTGDLKLANLTINSTNPSDRNITITKLGEEFHVAEPYKLKFSLGSEYSHDNYELVLRANSVISLYYKAFIALFVGLDCLNNPIINVPEFYQINN